jgi:hypothetical protein
MLPRCQKSCYHLDKWSRDLPDGRPSRIRVQPSLQKYSASQLGRNSFIDSPSRPSEGRFAIVTDAGRDAVDVMVPLTNGARADGEVVWS